MKKTTLLAVGAIMFAACSRVDMYVEDSNRQPVSEIRVTINDFTACANTRTQENSYQTSFTGNEQIGVFAIKTSGNTLLHNNIPYQYNASTGSWTSVNASDKIYVYGSGVTYYAYYPYSSSMNDKKSIAEIASAFTPIKNQSTYSDYTASDLMTGTGVLNSNVLNFDFTHAMSLIEIEITTRSNTVFTSNPVFYNMSPWEMTTDNLYRYIVKPGASTKVEFEYGPADNRCGYQKELASADVIAGKYTKIKATFENINMELNTGNYTGSLGTPVKVMVNGKNYSLTPVSGSNNKYTINGGRTFTTPITSFDIYINDNLVNTEQLLLSATPSKVTVNESAKTITVNLSAGGMEGDGTSEADPYLVTTPVQLRGVAQNSSAYYKQMEDIDLSIYTNWQSKSYSGTYDGNHKSISNLTCINGTGLFLKLGGTIKNAHITSGSITNSGTAGGFCENVEAAGTIENCSNAATITGTVKGSGFFGGICGELHGKALHCKNTGIVTGKGEIFGGVIGWVNTGTLQYSYNAGEVKPDEPYHASKSAGVGGVAGAIYYGSPIISYCYNIGIVRHYDSESTSGGGSVQRGEIVGWTQSGNGVNNNWYATGTGNKASGDNAVNSSNQGFDNASGKWPVYSTDPSNGWGSTHWKEFVQGGYPKLLWE